MSIYKQERVALNINLDGMFLSSLCGVLTFRLNVRGAVLGVRDKSLGLEHRHYKGTPCDGPAGTCVLRTT